MVLYLLDLWMKKQVKGEKVMDDPRELPGFKKKSFAMAFGGGEIWFEHLDGIYDNTELVLEKLSTDRALFSKPSVTSLICFNIDETVITNEIIDGISDALVNSDKQFRKVCFVGSNRATMKLLKKALKGKGFMIEFINDFEKAKEWLIFDKGN